MSGAGWEISGRAAELRHAFDLSFASPPPAPAEALEGLLAVRVAGEAYALRVAEATGLVASRRTVPLPGGKPALLGIAGVRGAIVPVYGLAGLLGLAPGAEPPRWLVLCGGTETVGLAFDRLDGHLRIALSELRAATGTPAARHVTHVARSAAWTGPVLSIPSLVASLEEE